MGDILVTNIILTVLCIVAVTIIYKKTKFLTKGAYFSVVIFILLSIFLGRGMRIYRIIPFWDKGLHFLSGFIAVAVARHLYSAFGGDTKNKTLFNLFAITFAVAVAGVWEIYEFTIDSLFGMQSQNGSLQDTMWDIILGTVSGLISVILSLVPILKNHRY